MAESVRAGKGEVDMIIKLGGSAITNKSELEQPKLAEIRRAVDIVLESRRGGRKCIIVHGAGSFGHHHAKQYKVNQGVRADMTEEEQQQVKLGFCKTRQSVTKLNQLVTGEFVAAGLPAVALSPCGQWVTSQRSVQRDSATSVLELLQAGYIPVVHGDCVLDIGQGCSILSGDTIIQELCVTFQPPQVIFLSDVLGIYDKPPNQPGACLVPQVHVQADGNIDIPVITSIHKEDVTGGIQLKLMSAIDIVCRSQGTTGVFICGVNSGAARCLCVHGELRGEPATAISYRPTGVQTD